MSKHTDLVKKGIIEPSSADEFLSSLQLMYNSSPRNYQSLD